MRDANVDPCKGSAANPLSDADLDRKFLEQARTRVDAAAAQRLLQACRDVEAADDVAAIARLASLRN
jgi:hypothetical protein